MKKDDAQKKVTSKQREDLQQKILKEIDKLMQPEKKRKIQTKKIKRESLVGKCLVYIGEEGKDFYNKSVIYVTECTEEIVRGIMINKLLFGSAAVECKSKESGRDKAIRNVYEDLYQGGPENPAHGYVLFPKDDNTAEDPFAEVHGDIAISTSFGVLQEILDGEGPEKKIIAMGHCVWHRGELEWEIFNNQWLIVPSNIELIFDTALADKWEKAKAYSGVNLNHLLPSIGLA